MKGGFRPKKEEGERLVSRLFLALCTLLVGCSAVSTGAGERGLEAARERQWTDALSHFERAVNREPENLQWRRERVRAALLSGSLPELHERLSDAGESETGSEGGAYELALIIAAEGEPGSDVEALRLLERVAERLPEEADVPYRMGLLRLEQERFDEAVVPLERAVELESRTPAYRIALADALGRSGREERAREVLRDLADLDPGEVDLRRARAVLGRLNSPQRRVPRTLRDAYRDAVVALSEESASPGEAVQLIEEALEAAPECAPLNTLNGLASVRLGQLGRARVAFERAVELWPGDPTPWMELASLAAEAENLSSAEEHLAAALRADPLSEDVWAELGRIRYQRQRYPESAEAFRRLVQLDGGHMLSRLWLGRALRRAERDSEAEAVYLELLEEHPETFEALLQLGHIYRRRRLEEEDTGRSRELLQQARHYYELALGTRPQDPMIQRILQSLEEGP